MLVYHSLPGFCCIHFGSFFLPPTWCDSWWGCAGTEMGVTPSWESPRHLGRAAYHHSLKRWHFTLEVFGGFPKLGYPHSWRVDLCWFHGKSYLEMEDFFWRPPWKPPSWIRSGRNMRKSPLTSCSLTLLEHGHDYIGMVKKHWNISK